MLSLLILIFNILALFFMIRIFFPNKDEMFFHPLLRKLADLTEPALTFLKDNKILNNRISPWIPFILILLIKGMIIEGSKSLSYFLSFSTFSVAFYEYIAFLVKVLFWSCWLTASSQAYNIYDDSIVLLHTVLNKILAANPFTKKISARNNPLRTFASLSLILLILIFISASFHEYYLNKNLPVAGLFLLSVKIIYKALLESLSLLPFLLFIRIILSWFMPSPTRMFLLLNAATEPVLAPLRRLNLVVGMIDFSPIIAFILLNFILELLQKILLSFPV